MSPEQEASVGEFFSALFMGSVAPARQIVVWCKGQPSRWCDSVPAAIRAAAVGAAAHDVYFGCSLQDPEAALSVARARAQSEGKPEPSLQGVRGVATSAVAIPGVWADIDIVAKGHKKRDLPPTIEEATALVREAIPLEPTLAVFTGGGVHLWWLFPEPWVFSSESDRLAAQALVHGAQESIRQVFIKRGFKLDSTHDLARVLRVPGTFNRKKEYGEPVPCQFIALRAEGDALPRYTREALAEHTSETNAPEAKERKERAKEIAETTNSILVRKSESLPPPFEFAIEDPKFKLTWDEKRKDLEDGSPSSYDFAMMLWCLARGWREQDIVDLCEARRARHKHESKEPRYYALSLSRARERVGMTAAEERLIEHAAEVEAEGLSPGKRGEVLKDLGSRLGVPILRVEKLLTDEPSWELVLTDGRRVPIGPIQNVRDCRPFTNAMAKVLGREFPDVTRQRWKAISGLVLAVAEEVDFGEESIYGGEAASLWLSRYLGAYKPSDDFGAAVEDQLPYLDELGRVYISLSHFRRWLFLSEREDWTRTKIAATFRSFGWERRHVNGSTRMGERTSRSFWSPPPEATPKFAKKEKE